VSAAPRRVHQVLAALSYGDAIGNEALAIQKHLRAAGFESDIFAESVHPRMAHLARPLWEYAEVSSPETVCLFHFSIGSAAGRLIFHAPDRLVAIYHNITPAEFFLGFHPHLAGLCYHGRRELSAFAPRTELALGDSEFNRQELVRELRVEEVVFTGHVEHDELMACYAESDLFLCLSEHEGFGVPLLEAMVFGLPVIAYDAGAVAETLRGGGVLLEDKDPLEVAALIDRVLGDDALRAAVMRTQARALASLRAVDFGALLLERLAPVLR
jgi:hypothetical protein